LRGCQNKQQILLRSYLAELFLPLNFCVGGFWLVTFHQVQWETLTSGKFEFTDG